MVTRVDRKPVVYATTLLRVIKPSARLARHNVLKQILEKSIGYAIPKVTAKDVVEDLEDLELGWSMFGTTDSYTAFLMGNDDRDEDEAIRLARAMQGKENSLRAKMRRENLDETIVKCQSKLLEDVDQVYCGIEAVYKTLFAVSAGIVFEKLKKYDNHKWALDSTASMLSIQAPYHFIHPRATDEYGVKFKQGITNSMLKGWEMYKRTETIATRLSSRKNILAHSHYLGSTKKHFEAAPDLLSDFELPLTGFVKCLPSVKMYLLSGIRYIKVQRQLYCLSHDDSVSLSMMAQCYAKTAFYFHQQNGYNPGTDSQALGVLIGLYGHICTLIDNGKLFSNFIRALHILAQKEFNDMWEETRGTDLGWADRSKNYVNEANELDGSASIHYGKILALAASDVDKLNINFLYHACLGDEMTAADLKAKVLDQVKKVRKADPVEWAHFMKFCKSYFLCKYMSTHKKKPTVAGDVEKLNSQWAQRCVSGKFTMPPVSEWGSVYIHKNFPWAKHADLWHLECQDVALVVKDEDGIVKGKYGRDPVYNSELLYALKHGEVLDHLTQSTPTSARDRITRGEPTHVVMLTCAPKAENAKPTWKKRITFSADNEFRKMQAEVDRNTRRCMAFVRGPSLGVNQHILESQFKDICLATSIGATGAVSSHDISAWSESLDRTRKFEFERILVQMSSNPAMSNIEHDWAEIKCAVTKQGMKECHEIKNSTFQGFDGSECTILHAVILFYCIDSAKRQNIIPKEVKADMADLIDDCVAVMVGLSKRAECNAFWKHLKVMYNKLGFEIDDLKSIYSTIKAIYLGRRFLMGGEVPADYKVYIKSHISYEDPLRCMNDYVSDIFGGMRNACEANGDPWFIYTSACYFTFMELAHDCPDIMSVPHECVPVIALAPQAENGWAFPSLLSWGTNDVTDKRSHYNCIMDVCAQQYIGGLDFLHGSNPMPRTAVDYYMSVKSQPWRKVGMSGIFNDPMGATRDGPMHADNLRKHAVADCLRELATAEPWVSLLNWDSSSCTELVREQLAESGILHAPTLQALVNCMPDAYKQSMLGKAIGSSSVLDTVRRQNRYILRRRVLSAARQYFKHSISLLRTKIASYSHEDICCINPHERATIERTEFYTMNAVEMTDHTFPDPIGIYCHSGSETHSYICPTSSKLRIWDQYAEGIARPREWISNHGIFVPPQSNRVWEIAQEYGRGWDQVSRRIATGLAILARAEADGHDIEGLHIYFIRAWNEMANIDVEDTQLVSIQGSVKRLDSNPGSSVHQIAFARNLSTGFDVFFNTVLDAIPTMCNKLTGSTSHLHDMLSHSVAMRAVCVLSFYLLANLRALCNDTKYRLACRPEMIMPCDSRKMKTGSCKLMIEVIINDSATHYGLMQASKTLSGMILVPTTQYGWSSMINALAEGDYHAADTLVAQAQALGADEQESAWAYRYAEYSSRIVQASAPVKRSTIALDLGKICTVGTAPAMSRTQGDVYSVGIKHHSVKIARALTDDHPEHIGAAIVIRSMVWDKLKDKNLAYLAAIFYGDPDADYSVLKDCSAQQFWTPIVREVGKHKLKRHLSECIVFGCRVLGVESLELNRSNDILEISTSVASFFGAHLQLLTRICGDTLTTMAGRVARDYEKPVLLRTITHNPGVVDNAKRREHLKNIVKYNIDVLRKRVADIKRGYITHRGDKRLAAADRKNRIIELRCRRFVYECANINDACEVEYNCSTFCKQLIKSGRHALVRAGVPKNVAELEIFMEEFPEDMADCLDIMEEIGTIVIENKGYWNTAAGSLGFKTAMTWLADDTLRAVNTKFAISPSELIPKTYRIKTTTLPMAEVAPPAMVITDTPDIPSFGDDTFGCEDIADILTKGASVKLKAGIPLWKALFALILCGRYDPADVNNKIGVNLTGEVTLVKLRDLALHTLSDDDIRHAYPYIDGDYITGGVLFDEEWLSAAEAEGYTVDD